MTVLYVRCVFLGIELVSAQLLSVDLALSQHVHAAILTEGLSQIFLHQPSLKLSITTVLDLHQTYEDLCNRSDGYGGIFLPENRWQ